jgi:hypothetical protein
MRFLALVCLALVFGFLLGRWAPQSDLDHSRREVEELQKLVKRGGGRGGGGMMGVDALLRLSPPTPAPAPVPPSLATNATAQAEAEVAPPPEPPRDNRTLRERLEEAREVWEMRSDLARSSFLNNLHASEVQARDFDVLVAAMNLKMEQRVADWVESVRGKEVIRPEDGARLMHGLIGASLETYDEFDHKLPGNWREEAGEDFMLFDFVNPAVGERLLDVEEAINRGERGRRVDRPGRR